MIIRILFFLMLMMPVASAQTWEAYVDGQIKHHQDMELEEKKIEVLARMQQLGASNINVSGVSSSQSRSFSRSKTTSSNINKNK